MNDSATRAGNMDEGSNRLAPTVSVIATVLNEAETIEGLVASLRAQSTQPKEVVIVDGGSTDGTWEALQRLSKEWPTLKAFRDESCNLAHCKGPIARGRNMAITVASSAVIACCDAGCRYDSEWLKNLTAPFEAGAEYVLGGSRIDAQTATAWDIAAAPLMGVSTEARGMRKSCTARSMAFTKKVWLKAGGFPESTLLGEDTLFDLKVREVAQVSYAVDAMAIYEPRFTYKTAMATIRRYAAADGALGLRRNRFVRMLTRCAIQVGGVATAWWTWKLIAVAAVVELFSGFERDRSPLKPSGWRAMVPRLIFSVSVPWMVAITYARAKVTRQQLVNRQNA